MDVLLEEFLAEKVISAFQKLQEIGSIPNEVETPQDIKWTYPKNKQFGDLSTNCFISLSKNFSKTSKFDENVIFAQTWARSISDQINPITYTHNDNNYEIRCENRGKGFLNFFIPKVFHKNDLEKIKSENLDSDSSISMQVIGKVRSSFRGKYATPRQGQLVPTSCGVIELSNDIQLHTLIGLSEFSHIWILYIFHNQNEYNSKSMVKPAKLFGEKRGTFATRSPHRPSPIGLCVAKIREIHQHRIWVTGIDIIDGTPVIDIKPYHFVDAFPMHQNCKFPNWVEKYEKIEVEYEEECVDNFIDTINKMRANLLGREIESFENKVENKEILELSRVGKYGGVYPFRFYPSVDIFLHTIKDCLELDPRTVRNYHENAIEAYQFHLDDFEINYYISEQKAFITSITHDNSFEKYK